MQNEPRKRCVNFPYTGIGTWAMKAFLGYLIKYKKGLSYRQRNNLLSKVEKSCTMKYISDGTMRQKLLKGIEKIGQPDPQRYFDAYSKKHFERSQRRKLNGET